LTYKVIIRLVKNYEIPLQSCCTHLGSQMPYNMCCNLQLVSKVDRNHTYYNYVYAIIGSEYAYGLLISGLLSSWLVVVVVVLLLFLLLRWRGYVSVCSFAITGSVASFFGSVIMKPCSVCFVVLVFVIIDRTLCLVVLVFLMCCGVRKSIRCVTHGL
jgi:hypothetical protein